MKNVLKLRFFAYETGIRSEGEKKGQPYFVAKFLDDESKKPVSFIVEEPLLQERIRPLTPYQEYTVELDFVRNKYGNYDLLFKDVC